MANEIRITIDWGQLPAINLPAPELIAGTGEPPSIDWGSPPEWAWGTPPNWTWGDVTTGELPHFTDGGQAPHFVDNTDIPPSLHAGTGSAPRINWATRAIVDAITDALSGMGDIDITISTEP